MGKVIYSDDFLKNLEDIVDILFYKDYFGFKESAYSYVFDILDYFETHISILTYNLTPYQLKNFGKYYISFSPNSRTTWYILFDKMDEDFYVTFIFNNHVKYASYIEL